ncbi:MAG: HAD family hydrolase [Acidimicrobiales bacterium]
MTRLILWDIDGTLISSGGVGREALELGASSAGGLVEVPHVSMGGKTDPQIVAEILRAAGIGDGEARRLVSDALAVAEAHLAAGRHRMAEEGGVHPGVRELLERLAHAPGVRQTLLTGNIRAGAHLKLGAFGLEPFFDFAIGAFGSDHADRDRLVPLALARAAEIHGEHYAPEEVWVIGDTANDLRCARAGGVRCLLVGTGKEGFGAVSDLEADLVVPDLADTESVLGVLVEDTAPSGTALAAG